MHVLALLIACACLCLQVWLSFDEIARKQWYFYPGVIGSSALTSACWCWCVWLIDDNDRIFVWSVLWEACVIAIWYFLPVILFYVEIRSEAFLAVVLVAVGLMMLQLLHRP